MDAPANANYASDAVSLDDLRAILARRKWKILGTFLAIFSLVAVVILLLPKQYESHMKILVKNERPDMIVSAGNGDGSGYRAEVSETAINSEIELLNGLNLLQQVVTESGLDKLEKANDREPGERGPVTIERATARLQKSLSITPVRKANIIQIDYSARDPHQAANVLRHLADSYLEAHLKVHGTPGTYQFFSTQADRYGDELKNAEAKQEQFRQSHSIVMLAQQKDAMLQKATDSEAALLQAGAAIREHTDRIADTRRQLAQAPARVLTQNRAVPNQYSVEHLSSMLAELQNRRTQLLAKFRPEDRMVQEVEKEISDTQATLDRTMKLTASEQSTDINPVHQALEIDLAKEQTELAGVEARRRALAQQAQAYRTELMSLGNATAEYDDLTRTQKKAKKTIFSTPKRPRRLASPNLSTVKKSPTLPLRSRPPNRTCRPSPTYG